ncbi:MAG: gamma-glutamylcyclotransferase [Pseudomonadota bacterium]
MVDASHGEWIFGYGSLIWRADFPFVTRQPAYICDWTRRFWQGSTDHRGYPGRPGRVVTLISAPGELCWGMAYRIDPRQRQQTLDHLDYREKGGYERLNIPVFFAAGGEASAIVYHATQENPEFLGKAPTQAIAEQVINSIGPSGPNTEYVLELEAALRDMDAQDPHVFEVAALVRELRQSQTTRHVERSRA